MTAAELEAARKTLRALATERSGSDPDWYVLMGASTIVQEAYLAAAYPEQEPVQKLAGRRVTDSRVGRDSRDADVIQLPRRADSRDPLDAA